jgi:hypothetical protein
VAAAAMGRSRAPLRAQVVAATVLLSAMVLFSSLSMTTMRSRSRRVHVLTVMSVFTERFNDI